MISQTVYAPRPGYVRDFDSQFHVTSIGISDESFIAFG
jgi:hypothetical protein